ncbi:hypothetical protein JR316_0005736 [Psilocybe cubensis]|uniref:Uncharacterized protein n=1 Tax=Psilocybe cubensis TaxID=181762 RepID=A0ACB8H0E7_PSICU|nr:hypothetical protein JR316_0005736 [Psilocybe cubensis]KAH9481215.1 hypothetical protein JR316_0005736 [Psilocybe cubensis]
MAPQNKAYKPSHDIRQRIAEYISPIIKKSSRSIQVRLPQTLVSWGKVRIMGGDTIEVHSEHAIENKRSRSWVKYELLGVTKDRNNNVIDENAEICYGRLELILEFNVPGDDFWGLWKRSLRLLAVVTPYRTNGKNAATTLTVFRESDKRATIALDLQSITNAIGRIYREQKGWAIVDRSDEYSRTIFVHGGDPEEPDDDDALL